MDQAAGALREQGAIDIQLHSADQGELDSMTNSHTSLGISIDEKTNESYVLQVVVESSRSRQAEDTLARFGGQR